ncbi:DUF2268 domain-containing protein [Ornithinibacillus salinisoli]|uniref:DUF2268 domain-containing protein n=1 Tax=Ornithinibacillus salinisoli TaxID=1848459 RepID=A0ABW4W483_9BACI
MSIIATDQWLLESYETPLELCKKLEQYFEDAAAVDIYPYLTNNGMYRHPHPFDGGKELVEEYRSKQIWKIIKQDERKLRHLWKGPDIPIIILPADTTNRKLSEDYNGKSGLAFHDKLFLFVSPTNTEKDIKSLFTHEYNHICRLSQYKKKEKDYRLLDSIILEGLAENAVQERFGNQYTAAWTSYYTDDELERMWERIILPHKNLSKLHPNHTVLLYGQNFHPKMIGYCVGYYLVTKYVSEKGLSSKDLLEIPSEEIANIK